MRTKLSKILVTGGAGFIGSAFVRLAVSQGYGVVVMDKLTYAGDLLRLKQVKGMYRFYKADICRESILESIFGKEKPEAVLNFAAETHVDRSIHSAREFVKTNVAGTETILSISKKYKIKRFVQISSDEVYGDIKNGEFLETRALNPSSPYAAAKASGDLFLKSYIRTYDFPGIIVRPSNNYGPWQYPEKLIPLAVLKASSNQKIPLFAKGKNVREWLYVDDCASGILHVLEKGRTGEIYNLGSSREKQNIEVARAILKALNADSRMIRFVKDRQGHDIRYKLNWRKMSRETGWKPLVSFEQGLKKTVDWCLENKSWLLSKSKGVDKWKD